MYKKIMAAVDGSETAKQALMEAMNIANNYNAALCIVHCLKGDSDADKKAGTQILEEAESCLSTLSVETRLLEAETASGSNFGLSNLTTSPPNRLTASCAAVRLGFGSAPDGPNGSSKAFNSSSSAWSSLVHL